jgi:hypothetical protein
MSRCRRAEQVSRFMCPKSSTDCRQHYNTLWTGKVVIGNDRTARPMSRMGHQRRGDMARALPVYPELRTTRCTEQETRCAQFRHSRFECAKISATPINTVNSYSIRIPI